MARLVNPYVLPVLYIRKPGDDNETCIKFSDDDPFFSEISTFFDVIEGENDSAKILSSYEGKYNIPFIPNSVLCIIQMLLEHINSPGLFA